MTIHSAKNFDWIKKGNPSLVLAPMEGITDFFIRALLTKRGGFDFVVSEFLRVSQNIPPTFVFYRHLGELKNSCKTYSNTPVQLQLLGGDENKIAQTAFNAIQLGVKAIDLNFGCPAKTVNNNDGGASLLRHPLRIKKIIETTKSCIPSSIPVSAKLRLGWDDPNDIYKNAEAAIEGGASWLTIHARTKAQGYQPPVFWKHIGEIQKWNAIPVIANGDIWNIDDFLKCKEITNCEHFMIGRGAMVDPTLPNAISSILKNKNLETQEAPFSWLPLIEEYIQITNKKISPQYLICRIKQWLTLSNSKKPIACYNELKRLPSNLNEYEILPSIKKILERQAQ